MQNRVHNSKSGVICTSCDQRPLYCGRQCWKVSQQCHTCFPCLDTLQQLECLYVLRQMGLVKLATCLPPYVLRQEAWQVVVGKSFICLIYL